MIGIESIVSEHLFLVIYQEGHEEAQEELAKKAKYFFITAFQNWDAEFYVKVDDNIGLDLGRAPFSLLDYQKLAVMVCLINFGSWLTHFID